MSAQKQYGIERAIEHHEQALVIAREIGNRRSEGNQLGNLGVAYRDLGQVEWAKQHWVEALCIFEEIKSPTAEIVLQWLAEFDMGFEVQREK